MRSGVVFFLCVGFALAQTGAAAHPKGEDWLIRSPFRTGPQTHRRRSPGTPIGILRRIQFSSSVPAALRRQLEPLLRASNLIGVTVTDVRAVEVQMWMLRATAHNYTVVFVPGKVPGEVILRVERSDEDLLMRA